MPKAEVGENDLPPKGGLSLANLFNVKNKVAIVTGGGSGIGAMISAGLVENGAKVYIVSRKDISPYATQLTQRGPGSCHALKADVTIKESLENFAEEVTKLEPQGIDILINNAGTNWNEKIDVFSEKGWDKVYDLNTKAVFFVTQIFLKLLEKKGTSSDPSRVINISSIAGEEVDSQGIFSYNSGKAATTHLSKHMAVHLAHRNINVNAICPGFFESRMTRGLLSAEGKHLMSNIPLQRFGKIEDMAGLVLYLCGKSGTWVTGTKFILDGGQTLHVPNSLISKL